MLVPRQDHVDVELRQLGEDVAGVEDDVALASRPRDRDEMVMDDEDGDVTGLVELPLSRVCRADPRVQVGS